MRRCAKGRQPCEPERGQAVTVEAILGGSIEGGFLGNFQMRWAHACFDLDGPQLVLTKKEKSA